ncbi:MAG: NnrS family protein [Verrucomicrobiota bacterium]|nr:NnrS family protein [Verrucomicrobiota bacterium]
MQTKKFLALAAAEPFRIFFPLGLVLGAIGVSLWPLFYWHLIAVYPAPAHMRLMIEGLMGSFVVGFLGTAGPRLLEAAPFDGRETLTLFGLQTASAVLHLARQQAAGDILFLVLLLFFGFTLVRRRTGQSDLPPPSFVLVAGGLVNALAGVLLVLLAGHSLFADQLGRLLLNEGFILFPLLGVGTFFFPKLLEGEAEPPINPQVGNALWRRGAAIAVACAVVLWTSFVIEALGWTRSAAVLRGLTTGMYFVTQGQLFRGSIERTFLARVFEFGAILLTAGLFLPLFLPSYRVADLHVVLIGGFSVILFTVSTRVILGHSGHAHLFQQRRLRFLIAAIGLLVLAMLTRLSADLFPGERNSYLVYAALAWLLAAGVWGWALLPKLRLSEN